MNEDQNGKDERKIRILTNEYTILRTEITIVFRHIFVKKEFNGMKLNISIRNNGRLKKVSMMGAELTND